MNPYSFERKFVISNDNPSKHQFGTDSLFPYATGVQYDLLPKRTSVKQKITDWTPSFFGPANTPTKLPWDMSANGRYL